MIPLICGNFVALLGSLLMVYLGTIKETKKIIFIQTIQIFLFTLSTLILGGFSGTIVNAISVVRNILCYKDKLTNTVKAILILLCIPPCLIFNNLGILGLLPLISTILFTCFMNVKNPIKLKYLLIVTLSFWVIYDILIYSYTSAIFEFFAIIAHSITVYQLLHKKQN